ncbi:MAG: hypothetical protein CVU64_20500 [Deltaproteobacteria bacterium HGW-Deltaproteobacteria-21]|nr:MAG: hypothetical protein CVU64_20500 [Deltaproteobacteria bacterium HGW-Deltaproteobacteria-21]
MELPTAVIEAKESGSEVLELTSEEGNVYYFRKPGKSDMNRYLTLAAKQKLASAAQNLIYDLAIHPGRDEIKGMVDEKPGLMVALSNALQNAVGLNAEFEVKKL